MDICGCSQGSQRCKRHLRLAHHLMPSHAYYMTYVVTHGNEQNGDGRFHYFHLQTVAPHGVGTVMLHGACSTFEHVSRYLGVQHAHVTTRKLPHRMLPTTHAVTRFLSRRQLYSV